MDKDSRLFELLMRFTVVLYDKTSQLCFVNEARQKLFCQKDKVSMEALPPTRAALFEHCKRAMYQAGIWTTADEPIQQAPSPGKMGWTFDEERQVWVPFWSELDEISKACSHLVKCQCLKACGSACSCGKRGWKCSKRCGCKCRKWSIKWLLTASLRFTISENFHYILQVSHPVRLWRMWRQWRLLRL